MQKEIIEKLKQTLKEEQVKLKEELASFAKEDKDVPHNWETRYPSRERGNKEEEADEAGEYENLLSLEQKLELKLRDVEVALEKMAQDKYGVCENCGKNIEEERLMANPAARLCIHCK